MDRAASRTSAGLPVMETMKGLDCGAWEAVMIVSMAAR